MSFTNIYLDMMIVNELNPADAVLLHTADAIGREIVFIREMVKGIVYKICYFLDPFLWVSMVKEGTIYLRSLQDLFACERCATGVACQCSSTEAVYGLPLPSRCAAGKFGSKIKTAPALHATTNV